MIGIFGIVITFAMVFGGYLAAGGHMAIILKALPFELMIIGGAAVGAFVLGNDLPAVKATLRAVPIAFRGPRFARQDYTNLLCLLYALLRLGRQNPVALEEHIENPESSAIFQRYPRILGDHLTVELICDTLRSAAMNYDDPMQVEEVLDKRIERHLAHALHPSHALQIMADGLPALGIVAAVLGVIKTMGSIDQPPEILGKMIGGALVGTFLGVFLAYGFVGPLAVRLRAAIEQDQGFYTLIREVLVANLHQHPTNICIEVGRQNAPGGMRPDFAALEDALRDLRREAVA